MSSHTNFQQNIHSTTTSRPLKSLPALGVLLFVGVSIFAATAGIRSAGEAVPIEQTTQVIYQGDKTPTPTAKAVAAADKFLAALDEQQKAKAVYDFDSDKRPRWSNLPVTFVPRNGAPSWRSEQGTTRRRHGSGCISAEQTWLPEGS